MGGRAIKDPYKEWRLTAVKALTESIAHWERLRDGVSGEEMGPDSCALCDAWFDYGCIGCPIRERTQFSGCTRTPYHDATFAVYGSPSMARVAERELEFLRETRHLVKLRKVNPTEPPRGE